MAGSERFGHGSRPGLRPRGLTNFICATCASQFESSEEPPERCPICEDERQYVGLDGQKWTTPEELRANHRARFVEEEPGLLGIGMSPEFAIGQRALLVPTPDGNILWDCIPLIDDQIVARVREAGGLDAIAISHPHYYSAMAEWAEEFDAPIYLHARDKQWVMRSDGRIVFWEEDVLELKPGVTLINSAGHFEGGAVLHWAAGAEGRGALLTGDIIQVIPDRDWVSFMYSYPNLIPLPPSAIENIVASVEPFEFDRIHGAWFGRTIPTDAKAIVKRSADRYIRAVAVRAPSSYR